MPGSWTPKLFGSRCCFGPLKPLSNPGGGWFAAGSGVESSAETVVVNEATAKQTKRSKN